MKRKVKIDPRIIQEQEQRKRRKYDSQLAKLDRQERTLKPVDEYDSQSRLRRVARWTLCPSCALHWHWNYTDRHISLILTLHWQMPFHRHVKYIDREIALTRALHWQGHYRCIALTCALYRQVHYWHFLLVFCVRYTDMCFTLRGHNTYKSITLTRAVHWYLGHYTNRGIKLTGA